MILYVSSGLLGTSVVDDIDQSDLRAYGVYDALYSPNHFIAGYDDRDKWALCLLFYSHAVLPASIVSVLPVIMEAESPKRYETPLATSSTLASEFNGLLRLIDSSF